MTPRAVTIAVQPDKGNGTVTILIDGSAVATTQSGDFSKLLSGTVNFIYGTTIKPRD